jgi:hypothetical protein
MGGLHSQSSLGRLFSLKNVNIFVPVETSDLHPGGIIEKKNS